MIASIAMVKDNQEMVHPAIIPISNGCHDVVYSDVVIHNCKFWKMFFTRFVIVFGTWKYSKAFQRRACLTDPNAFVTSRNKKVRSLSSPLADWI